MRLLLDKNLNVNAYLRHAKINSFNRKSSAYE